jgi:tRNA(Ile)-lysidine synthase
MGHAPDFDLVERLREQHGQPVAIGPQRCVSRDIGGLIRAQKNKPSAFDGSRIEVELKAGKGQVRLDGLTLMWKVLHSPSARLRREPKVEYFDADKVGGTVWLRHWQAGDRFQPIGMKSARKLQDLFTDLKVPRDERHRRIVAATSRGELFWVEGLRMAERFKLEPGTVRRLKWRWRRRKL